MQEERGCPIREENYFRKQINIEEKEVSFLCPINT